MSTENLAAAKPVEKNGYIIFLHQELGLGNYTVHAVNEMYDVIELISSHQKIPVFYGSGKSGIKYSIEQARLGIHNVVVWDYNDFVKSWSAYLSMDVIRAAQNLHWINY